MGDPSSTEEANNQVLKPLNSSPSCVNSTTTFMKGPEKMETDSQCKDASGNAPSTKKLKRGASTTLDSKVLPSSFEKELKEWHEDESSMLSVEEFAAVAAEARSKENEQPMEGVEHFEGKESGAGSGASSAGNKTSTCTTSSSKGKVKVSTEKYYEKLLKKWERPPVEEAFQPTSKELPLTTADNGIEGYYPTKNLIFQQLDVSDYISYRSTVIPGMPGSRKGPVPVVRMYGVNESGNSVLCHVHGFLPYFYITAPSYATQEMLTPFRNRLNSLVASESGNASDSVTEPVMKVELVHKASVMHFQNNELRPFFRITVALPKHISVTKRVLMYGDFESVGIKTFYFDAFETNLEFPLRFMVDTKIVGCNWIELPSGSYSVRCRSGDAYHHNVADGRYEKGATVEDDVDPENSRVRDTVSHCQIEVDVSYDKLISHPAEGDWAHIAPVRVLSFDIECAGRRGVFPEANVDPVIQIANMVSVQGQSRLLARNVFTLDTCATIIGSTVKSFKDERAMLEHWSEFVRLVDPDLITGYNVVNFDIPYLLDRAKALNVDSFPYLGRLQDVQSKMTTRTFSSKALGTRENKDISIDGRVQFDVFQILQRDHKLSSYTLNAVSAHFLGEQKEDVQHSIITDLQNGNEQTRRRLAVYCLKDAYLPLRLMDKLMCLYNYMEMARVTGVPLNYLLTRGQQIKVVSQLYRRTCEQNFVIPMKTDEVQDYEGATVIEPKRDYYDVPIATLDFSSLYPSIMMAYNLCYTTLIPAHEAETIYKDCKEVHVSPLRHTFCNPSLRKGILPQILEDLLSARKRAKADLKKEKDPFKRAVLDGRQLALKISANSVYGFTGATVGKLPCLEISSSVTAYGRQMIEQTKQEVEKRFNKANGYEHDADVVYGDTDSVMVNFGVKTVKEAMELGEIAAKAVTETFPRPINLEFEKVYFPYLLINKKRYAGLYWTNPDKYDKMDCKGIETVRRDNCPLVKNLLTTVLQKILIDRDVQGAIYHAKYTISQLLQNKIDIAQLVITKQLSKDPQAPQVGPKLAHLELARRMHKRDPGSAPVIGDRVPYIVVKKTKNAPAYEKSEDPIYVVENNIPIDTQYYLENQLAKPLLRIFEPVMKQDVDSLLTGDHTRHIAVATPTVGGLMQFTKVTKTCLGCRAPLKSDTKSSICSDCAHREGEIYQKQVEVTTEMEQRFSKLWTQCQRCQGSLHQDVLCSSRDCPIFYMRKKVQNDLKVQHDKLARFGGNYKEEVTDW
eukprot:Nk52_evm11s226 gene=Nk52_evmTU11s226